MERCETEVGFIREDSLFFFLFSVWLVVIPNFAFQVLKHQKDIASSYVREERRASKGPEAHQGTVQIDQSRQTQRKYREEKSP